MRLQSIITPLLAFGATLMLAACGSSDKSAPAPQPARSTVKAEVRKVQLADRSHQIAMKTASASNEDPAAAGKAAALAIKAQLGDLPVKAVILSECYEGAARKAKVLEGVCSVFPAAIVYGGSTYGNFTQSGVASGESVTLAAFAGKDLDIAVAYVEKMNTTGLTLENDRAELEKRLRAAGESLARKLPANGAKSKLMLVIADAHSPKNGFVVEGIQSVLGATFPITGGSVNKNAGQSFVYHQGKMTPDAAVALLLSGDFKLAMAGRQAKENDLVISTAREGASEALTKLEAQKARPAFVLAFDCAGRKGKLKNVADELTAVRQGIGADVPLFGTYNAGEIGPADMADQKPGVLSSGVGWHAMFTIIGW